MQFLDDSDLGDFGGRESFLTFAVRKNQIAMVDSQLVKDRGM